MEVEPVKMAVTCHTAGCPVDGQTFVVDMYPNETEPIWRAVCGRCGNPVTDIVPAA